MVRVLDKKARLYIVRIFTETASSKELQRIYIYYWDSRKNAVVYQRGQDTPRLCSVEERKIVAWIIENPKILGMPVEVQDISAQENFSNFMILVGALKELEKEQSNSNNAKKSEVKLKKLRAAEADLKNNIKTSFGALRYYKPAPNNTNGAQDKVVN